MLSKHKKMTGDQLREEVQRLDEYLSKVETCDQKEDDQYTGGSKEETSYRRTFRVHDSGKRT